MTGLHEKYAVVEDGEPVEDCFVLEPGSDPAAREALETYADATADDDLADDLREWVRGLEPEPFEGVVVSTAPLAVDDGREEREFDDVDEDHDLQLGEAVRVETDGVRRVDDLNL